MTPLYTAKSSAALALRYEPDEAKALDTVPPPAPRRPITYQPSLFASRELPRVVPFETIAPGPVQAPVRRAVSSKPRVRRPKVVSGQQDLPFAPNAPSRRARPSEGVIYCDAPVAPPAHRAVAVLLDGVLISIGLAVFGSIFWLAGGRLHWNAQTLPVLLGVVAGVVLLYNLLWCLGDGDTAGMKWSHLKLVDFDGHVPNRAQRFKRMASGLLSLAAAGLGLLWALADTETLTWHDHISKTFPTPY